jgi:hypothetical protein
MMRPITPERCTLVNLQTGARCVCQFNPTLLEVQGGAPQYARLEPLGVPHQVLHYRNTENRRVPLSFYMDAIGQDFDVMAFRRFLQAAALPTTDVGLSKPPAILIVWPGALTAVGHLTELTWSVEQMSPQGQPLVCTARCTLEIDERATQAQGGH